MWKRHVDQIQARIDNETCIPIDDNITKTDHSEVPVLHKPLSTSVNLSTPIKNVSNSAKPSAPDKVIYKQTPETENAVAPRRSNRIRKARQILDL